jgi:hypothetical protein
LLGSTTFLALLGVCGFAGHKAITTTVCWALGHVLDHGVKPDPVYGLSCLSPPPLLVGSQLDPGNFDRAICHCTNFYANGWGIRKLTVDELGSAFGPPSWMRAGQLKNRHLAVVPAQIIDGCLHGLFTEAIRAEEVLATPLVWPP